MGVLTGLRMSGGLCVVFDLDGTLIDSVPDVRNALNAMLAGRGRRPLAADEVSLMVGEGARVMIERALAATGGVESYPATGGEVADTDAVLAEYLAAYSAHPVIDTVIYPGAVAALARLAEAGHLLGICTNKPEAITRLVLDGLGLTRFFAAIVGGDTLAFRKPDPRHVMVTLERMGAHGPAIYVGDSETDVAAARGAGLPVVAVSFGYSKGGIEALGADRVIDHFDQLDAALTELRGGCQGAKLERPPQAAYPCP